MYLRPDYYKSLEEKSSVLLLDLIVDVQNGKDFYAAYDEVQTWIYKSANPLYNFSVDKIGVFCYWNL